MSWPPPLSEIVGEPKTLEEELARHRRFEDNMAALGQSAPHWSAWREEAIRAKWANLPPPPKEA